MKEVNAHQLVFVFRQLLEKCEHDIANGWSPSCEEVDIARKAMDVVDKKLALQDRIRTGGK